jgi:hypothetical protein
MRKLYLTLAAAAAVVSTGLLAQPANAMTPVAGLRAAVEETAMVDQVRWVCTHFWNGRWHHREHCFWVPGHRHRHHHHHHH